MPGFRTGLYGQERNMIVLMCLRRKDSLSKRKIGESTKKPVAKAAGLVVCVKLSETNAVDYMDVLRSSCEIFFGERSYGKCDFAVYQ